MLKDIMFMMILFAATLYFGIYVITNSMIKQKMKPAPIERTVEIIDPDYDKKVGR